MILDRKVILKYERTVFILLYGAVTAMKYKINETVSYRWSICPGIGNGRCCVRTRGLGNCQGPFHLVPAIFMAV